jgi:hypothetical protein
VPCSPKIPVGVLWWHWPEGLSGGVLVITVIGTGSEMTNIKQIPVVAPLKYNEPKVFSKR